MSSYLGSITSGVIVAIISYFLLQPREHEPTLDLTYSTISLPIDIYEVQGQQTKDLLESVLRDIDTPEGHLEETIFEFSQALDMARFGDKEKFIALGSRPNLEEIELTNNEESISAEVKIEGREIEVAAVSTKSGGTNLYFDDFDEVIQLLPQETIRVLHISSFQNYSSRGGSGSLYVSTEGQYLPTSQDRPNIVQVMFGELIDKYPFLIFMLIIFGIFALLITALQLAMAIHAPLKIAIYKSQNTSKELGVMKYIIDTIETEDPQRFQKIKQASENISL